MKTTSAGNKKWRILKGTEMLNLFNFIIFLFQVKESIKQWIMITAQDETMKMQKHIQKKRQLGYVWRSILSSWWWFNKVKPQLNKYHCPTKYNVAV